MAKNNFCYLQKQLFPVRLLRMQIASLEPYITIYYFWRNHILGASMVLNGDIKHFTSITVYPKSNVHFSIDAMPGYIELLSPEGRKSFKPLTYEELFKLMDEQLNVENKTDWISYLKRRYLF